MASWSLASYNERNSWTPLKDFVETTWLHARDEGQQAGMPVVSRHSTDIRHFALEMWIGDLTQPIGGVSKEQEEIGALLQRKRCGLRMLPGRPMQPGELCSFIESHILAPALAEIAPREEEQADGEEALTPKQTNLQPAPDPSFMHTGLEGPDADKPQALQLTLNSPHIGRMLNALCHPALRLGVCRTEYQAIGLEGLATPSKFQQPLNLILGTSMRLVPLCHTGLQYSRYCELITLREQGRLVFRATLPVPSRFLTGRPLRVKGRWLPPLIPPFHRSSLGQAARRYIARLDFAFLQAVALIEQVRYCHYGHKRGWTHAQLHCLLLGQQYQQAVLSQFPQADSPPSIWSEGS